MYNATCVFSARSIHYNNFENKTKQKKNAIKYSHFQLKIIAKNVMMENQMSRIQIISSILRRVTEMEAKQIVQMDPQNKTIKIVQIQIIVIE